MKNTFTFLGIAIAIWMIVPGALAQEATEMFIPIGKSPGISGKYSLIGIIDSIETAEHTVYLRDTTGVHEIKLTDSTKIYLDKSGMKKPNRVGSYSDCMKGAYCEVLYKSHMRKGSGVAEWVKIRITPEMEK